MIFKSFFRAALAFFAALLLTAQAFAATSYVVRTRKITVFAGLTTLRVSQTRALDYEVGWPTQTTFFNDEEDITESDLANMEYTVSGRFIKNKVDEVVWESDEPNVAEVDEYGEVTGVSPGTATITVTLRGPNSRGRQTSLGSGSIELTVTESVPGADEEIYLPSSGREPERPDVPTFGNRAITSAEFLALVNDALVPGQNVKLTVQNAASVPAAALKSAAKSAADVAATVTLRFDTPVAGAVGGRVSLDLAAASALSGDLALKVRAGGDVIKPVADKVNGLYCNRAVVVKIDQENGFGGPVRYAVKSDKAYMRVRDLVLHSCDPSTGVCTKLEGDPAFYTDASGYIHFTADMGGWLVISEYELARK